MYVSESALVSLVLGAMHSAYKYVEGTIHNAIADRRLVHETEELVQVLQLATQEHQPYADKGIAAAGAQLDHANVFFAGLPWLLAEYQLRKRLEPIGPLQTVETWQNRRPPCAFVRFADIASAQKAIKLLNDRNAIYTLPANQEVRAKS